jgi:hypothetical protein
MRQVIGTIFSRSSKRSVCKATASLAKKWDMLMKEKEGLGASHLAKEQGAGR